MSCVAIYMYFETIVIVVCITLRNGSLGLFSFCYGFSKAGAAVDIIGRCRNEAFAVGSSKEIFHYRGALAQGGH